MTKLSVNVHRVARAAEKLQEAYFCELVDHVARGEVLDRLSFLTAETLQVEPKVAEESVLHLAGDKLTMGTLAQLAWRLAGNLNQLQRGQPVRPWTRQTHTQWLPAQVVRMDPLRMRKGDLGHRITLRVLSGPPAMAVFERVYSDRFWRATAVRWGFTKAYGKFPMRSPVELQGLRTCIEVPAGTLADEPRFTGLADLTQQCPSLLKYNRRLIRARCRDRSVFVCPFQMPLTLRCYLCPVGRDRCQVSLHAATYEQRHCPACRSGQAWFDPTSRSPICLDCARKRAIRRPTQEVSTCR